MIAPEPVVCKPVDEGSAKVLKYEEMKQFKDFMNKFCDSWNEIREKVDKVNIEEMKAHQTFFGRLYYNNMRTIYIGHDVTPVDIDAMVNTMSLVSALVLTVPYGIMTAANKGRSHYLISYTRL